MPEQWGIWRMWFNFNLIFLVRLTISSPVAKQAVLYATSWVLIGKFNWKSSSPGGSRAGYDPSLSVIFSKCWIRHITTPFHYIQHFPLLFSANLHVPAKSWAVQEQYLLKQIAFTIWSQNLTHAEQLFTDSAGARWFWRSFTNSQPSEKLVLVWRTKSTRTNSYFRSYFCAILNASSGFLFTRM